MRESSRLTVLLTGSLGFFIQLGGVVAVADETNEQAQARAALRKAVHFFTAEVAHRGGYLWKYSADLSKREGEGVVTTDTIWVQPPGTPAVAMAILKAYRLTGEQELLEAAIQSGEALVLGQIVSGGWMHSIDFDPQRRSRLAYRIDKKHRKRARKYSTFDDDSTQSSVRFLMMLDKTLEEQGRQNERIHECVIFALDSILKAQHANGGWSQVYSTESTPRTFKADRASFPESWSRTPDNKDYWNDITLNDGAMLDVIEALFYAYDLYGHEKYLLAAKRGADFLLAAQLPSPQPAWAQQYNERLQPCWARKFEPPAVSAGESQSAIRTLMFAYRATGDRKYMKPIPRALKYLEESEMPNGRLARFYEMKTNRPLFMKRHQEKGKWIYEVTYDSRNLPDHYGFIIDSKVAALRKQFNSLAAKTQLTKPSLQKDNVPKMSASRSKQAKSLIAAMDNRGAWVEQGTLKFHPKTNGPISIIDCNTFARNVVTLAEFVAAE